MANKESLLNKIKVLESEHASRIEALKAEVSAMQDDSENAKESEWRTVGTHGQPPKGSLIEYQSSWDSNSRVSFVNHDKEFLSSSAIYRILRSAEVMAKVISGEPVGDPFSDDHDWIDSKDELPERGRKIVCKTAKDAMTIGRVGDLDANLANRPISISLIGWPLKPKWRYLD